MLALFGLLAVGLAVSLIGDSDDDEGTVVGSEDTDLIIDEAYRDLVDEAIDTEGARLGATPEQIEAVRARVIVTEGSANIAAQGGDDLLYFGDGNDTILGGAGDDTVLGGTGDDLIELGEGDDVSGADSVFFVDEGEAIVFPVAPAPGDVSNIESDAFIEGGDDQVLGGPGMDLISDNFGSNLLHGQQGADFINSVDADEDGLTPDTVFGGFGADALLVDEGDVVTTGRGGDDVFVDLIDGAEDGYQEVVIEDFDIEQDRLVILVDQATLTEARFNPELVNVTPNDDGSGALIVFDGVPVINAVGAVGLTDEDVALRIL